MLQIQDYSHTTSVSFSSLLKQHFLLFMKSSENSIILELKILLDYENYAKNQNKSSVNRRKETNLYLNVFMTSPLPVKNCFLLIQTISGLSSGFSACWCKSTLCREQSLKNLCKASSKAYFRFPWKTVSLVAAWTALRHSVTQDRRGKISRRALWYAARG